MILNSVKGTANEILRVDVCKRVAAGVGERKYSN